MPANHDILAALSYFDLFDYPLTQAEIFQFLRTPLSHSAYVHELDGLVREGWVFCYDDCYSLQDDPALAVRRRKGNAAARKMMSHAYRAASLLSAFPFVRGVAVSGSLSKNYADERSDIDFFIITAKNRLWLARTFMHCFKKLTFLAGKQDWFCMNYYVDESMLEIREKNIYTATEVATLLPLRGIGAFQHFFARNKWSRDYLPNHMLRVSYVEELKNPFSKKIAEIVLNNPLGNLLDYLLMKLTARRWARKTKERKKNRRGVIMSLDANRHFAKPHPDNFQKKLIQVYEQKIVHLFRRYESRAKSIY